MKFSAEWFRELEEELSKGGHESDLDSFSVIKERLASRAPVGADEFARQAIYVVLAGGFSQKTAKRKHSEIMTYLSNKSLPGLTGQSRLLEIFNNKNKINAIIKIWENRTAFRDGYYKQNSLSDKLEYIATLPHIGKITANHLARNLGEDVVKYDLWITRLGAEFPGGADAMFAHLVAQTGLPRGYIDVVLWKSLQIGLIKCRMSE
ncbi:MAG: hypothetical protein LBB23_03825 [Rickettsiales bacterium]|jgi:hypothetical protein|nr:hypothetical protein [Rickettsiales bacterium]